jgi:hypothetical protein
MTNTNSNLKKIERATTYFRANQMEPGQKIKGKYLGTAQGKFTKEHRIAVSAQSTAVLNGTKQLDGLMELVVPGSEIEVVYQGTTELKSGPNKGKNAHNFDVFSGPAPEETNLTVAGGEGDGF